MSSLSKTKKQREKGAICIPELTNNNSLLILLAANQAGKVVHNPESVRFLNGYRLIFFQSIPGLQTITPNCPMDEFEKIFGKIDAAHLVRLLVRDNSWSLTKETLVSKAKTLQLSNADLSAIVKYGNDRISTLAALAIYYQTVNIDDEDVAKLTENMFLQLALTGKIGRALAYVRRIQLVQTTTFLTLNVEAYSKLFTTALLASATAKGPVIVMGNFVMWSGATAKRTTNGLDIHSGPTRPAIVLNDEPKDYGDIQLTPIKQQPMDEYEGWSCQIDGYTYLEVKGDQPIYYPLVGDKILLSPHTMKGTTAKPRRVVFHVPPSEEFKLFIAANTLLNECKVDWDNGCNFERGSLVTIGTSQPGDLVVENESHFFRIYQHLKTPFDVFKTKAYTSFMPSDCLDVVVPHVAQVLRCLVKITSKLSSDLAWYVVRAMEIIHQTSLKTLMTVERFAIRVVDGSVKILSAFWDLVFKPIIEVCANVVACGIDTCLFVLEQLIFVVVDTSMYVLEKVDIGLLKVTYGCKLIGELTHYYINDLVITPIKEVLSPVATTVIHFENFSVSLPSNGSNVQLGKQWYKLGGSDVAHANTDQNADSTTIENLIMLFAFADGFVEGTLLDVPKDQVRTVLYTNTHTKMVKGSIVVAYNGPQYHEYTILSEDVEEICGVISFDVTQSTLEKLVRKALKLNNTPFTFQVEDTTIIVKRQLFTIVCDAFDDTMNQAVNNKLCNISYGYVDYSNLCEKAIEAVKIASNCDGSFVCFNEATGLLLAPEDVGGLVKVSVQIADDDDEEVLYDEDCALQSEDEDAPIPAVDLNAYDALPIPSIDAKLETIIEECDDEFLIIVENKMGESESIMSENTPQTDSHCDSCAVDTAIDTMPVDYVATQVNAQLDVHTDDYILQEDSDTQSDVSDYDIPLDTVVCLPNITDNYPSSLQSVPDQKVSVYVGTLDKVVVDNAVLVNPANANLTNGGGAAAAIADIAGDDYQKFCNQSAPIKGLFVTSPFKAKQLGYECIAHVVAPRGTEDNVRTKLLHCYQAVLTKSTTYVIPILGVGIFGCNIVDSLSAFKEALGDLKCHVILVTLNPEHASVWESLNKHVVQYTTDFDQIHTKLCTDDEVLQLNLFDGNSFIKKPSAGVVYLSVQAESVQEASELCLTMPQYYLMLKYQSLEWSTSRKKGVVILKQARNNCYVSSVITFIQQAGIKFKGRLASYYSAYLNGNPSAFVAYCYAASNQEPGEEGNAIDVLNALCLGNVTVTGTVDCCGTTFTHDGVVYSPRIANPPIVRCYKCNIETTVHLTTPAIVVGGSMLEKFVGPAIYHSKTQSHWVASMKPLVGDFTNECIYIAADVNRKVIDTKYTVKNNGASVHHFADSNKYDVLTHEETSTLKEQTATDDTVVQPVKPKESKVTILDNPNTLDLLEAWILKPKAIMVRSWSVIGKVLFKANTVLKFAGTVAKKIYAYLYKVGAVHELSHLTISEAVAYVKDNIPKVKKVFKIVKCVGANLLHTLDNLHIFFWVHPITLVLRMIFLMLVWLYAKTGLPCYEENVYNTDEFCVDKGIFCKPCMASKDSIHLYKHLAVSQQPEYTIYYSIYALHVVLLVTNPYIWCVTVGLVYTFNYLEYGLPLYGVVQLNPFNTVLVIYSFYYLYRFYFYLQHICKGCKNPQCNLCMKKKISKVVIVDTVVQGRKYFTDIQTNGGTNFCEKHAFYCKQCDSNELGSTFIPIEVVESLSKSTGLAPRPTGPAYVIADDVTIQDSCYVARGSVGSAMRTAVFRASDITTVTALQKNLSYSNNVVIAVNLSDPGMLKQAREFAVLLALNLSRPIFIIDHKYDVKDDVFSEYKDILKKYYTFNEVTMTGDLYHDLKMATDGQASDDVLEAVKVALDRGVEFTVEAPNNTIPHYAFDFNSLSDDDQQLMIKYNCGSGVMKGTAINTILPASLVKLLSPKACVKIRNATSRNGVKFCVSPCNRMLRSTISVIPYTTKKGGARLDKKWLRLFVAYVIIFCVSYAADCIMQQTPPMYKIDIPADDFRVIRNGVLDIIRPDDTCFSNKFLAFDGWYVKPYTNSPHCPVVVGSVFTNGAVITGIPGMLLHREGLIVHIFDKLATNVLGHLNVLKHALWNRGGVVGYTRDTVVTGNSYLDSIALFNSQCAYLTYKSARELYCYDRVDDKHRLYMDVLPHVTYTVDTLDGGQANLVIPEQLLYWPYLVKFVQSTYCRMGHCFDTKPGYCVSFVSKFIYYSDTTEPGVFCGDTIPHLIANIFMGVVLGTDVFKSSVMLVFTTSMIIAIIVFVLTIQRFFKHYTMFVAYVVLTALANFVGLIVAYYIPIFLIPFYVSYVYIMLVSTPIIRAIGLAFMAITLVPLMSNVVIVATVVCFGIYGVSYYLWTVVSIGHANFTSFYTAAKSTFVIDNKIYVDLMNLAGDNFDTYLASYAKYRYYSGSADSNEYNKVCVAFLAKAMDTFKQAGGVGSVLYTPPKLAVVQAGIKKLLSPSGMVEHCVVSVTYQGSTLNGIWLHDTVYTPRHVIGKYTANQWKDMVNLVDNREFSVFCPTQGVNLNVVSVRMQGAVLQLKVHAKNLKTPDYVFERATPGTPMTIACAYDGVVQTIYHVVLQNNGLLFASFLNGACGSVGYTVRGSKLVLYYMHHIEFSNKTHGGTTMDGHFYGDYVDEEKIQHLKSSSTLTDNVMSHIFVHLLTVNRKPNWLAINGIEVADFNEWAVTSNFTKYPLNVENQKYLEALASIVKVPINVILATIVKLHANWGEARILGQSDFELDWTPQMVYNQTPVNLQNNQLSKLSPLVTIVFYSCFYLYIFFFTIPFVYVKYIIALAIFSGFITWLCIKHTMTFVLGYLVPILFVSARHSCVTFIPNTMLRRIFYYLFEEYFYSDFAFYAVCGFVIALWVQAMRGIYDTLHRRYYMTTAIEGVIRAISAFYIIFKFKRAWDSDVLDIGNFFELSTVFSPSLITTFSFFVVNYISGSLEFFSSLPAKLIIFYTIGFICTMRFGVFWLFNKMTGIPVGTYKYLVSRDELKYMMATRMRPPTNLVEVLWTNFKLMGVGGTKDIVLSTVQNRMLDAKATAVLVANLLEKTGVTSKHETSKRIVQLHNATLKAQTYEEAENCLVQLLANLLEFLGTEQLEAYVSSIEQNPLVLQAVVDNAIALDSYRVYKEADDAYKQSVANNESLAEQKKKLKIANIAKSEWDRDKAANKKLEKLADQAMKAMYLAERSEDRRVKLTSGLTAMLYHMLRRVNSDKVTALFECAKSNVIPIHAIAGSSTDGLKVLIDCEETYKKHVVNNSILYKGSCYTITKQLDLDNVQIDGVPKSYPIVIECVLSRAKCQNNELYVRNVYTAQAECLDVNDKTSTANSFYVTHNGKKICVAVTSDIDNLTTAVITTDTGKVVLTLEPPLRFAHVVSGKNCMVYLYFVKDVRTIFRGMVIGHISSTTMLQANGTTIEQQQNASLLTYLTFSADPKDAYLKHLEAGGKPLMGVVRVIAPLGEGFAVTTKPQPNATQYAYGGASVCLYCRSHTVHPNNACQYKGRFVHVDKDLDPVKFLLEYEPCTACQRWKSYDCTCVSVQSNTYLNRVRGSSGAQLEPQRPGSATDIVRRAFHVYNNKNVGIFTNIKTNCARHKVVGTEMYFVTKQCDEKQFRTEEKFYNILPQHFKGRVVPIHDFFIYDGTPNVVRQRLTKYTLLDLVYALRHLSTSIDIIKEMLIIYCGTNDDFFVDNWFDPIENVNFYSEIHKFGGIIANCVLKANEFVSTCNKLGFVGVLTPDNQDLEGLIYDYGDYLMSTSEGCIDMESYYSYLMPVMSMTHMLKGECLEDGVYKSYPIYRYDFTDLKVSLFRKYFSHWHRTYHPNTIDCDNDRCILHCSNFNILFSMCIPNTAYGNLCSQATVDGHPIIQTVGVHSKELGIVFNTDVVRHMSNINLTTLMRLVGDPTTHCAVADACIDMRTPCQTLASIASGATKQSVKPGHFNAHFYQKLVDSGLLDELGEDIKHFYFMQDGEAAIKDYSYYRYNTPTMVDISMFLFCLEVANCYLDCYEGGCTNAQNIVVNNLDKSAGFPFNKLGKARNYYDLTYAEQDELFQYTKRNVLPTFTQMNLKYAISAKDRARTVAGVSIVSTMTNRQYHQRLLKSISLMRNQTIVIGTTKFYGGWHQMLTNLIQGIKNPLLFGWDYPKCDRSMPNILRIASSLLLARKHSCCNSREKFYRLANECCQVLSEVVLSGNVLYVKPGGTSSGDATTAYANSVFNILQVVSANVATFLSTSTDKFDTEDVCKLHRAVYETIYRGDSDDLLTVRAYYEHLKTYFGLMILSDDGVACIDSKAASLGYVASLDAFRDLLFYQNNVYMSDSKCWQESDLSVGPHEFCSQHTILVEKEGEAYYLPYPNVSRILGACIFVDDFNKSDPVQNLERYISLAIDAYPLTKVSPVKGKVFYLLLDYIRDLARELHKGIYDTFQATTDLTYIDNFTQELFYSQMYERAPTLQATGACVVCNSPTILRCGDCIRRPLLCCVCCYQHITRTNHKRVMAINNYVCSVDTCNEDNVELLYISGTTIYCLNHKPALCIPIVSNGTVFGIYRHTARGSDDIEVFNSLATSEYNTIDPYRLANSVSTPLMLFAAETIKAKEEAIKRSYAVATVRDTYDGRIIKLSWEIGKKIPPISKNHIFIGYHFNKNGKTQVGDYTLVKCDGDSYMYKGTSTYRLQVGDTLTLMSHVVTPLSAPPVLVQVSYTRTNYVKDTLNCNHLLNHFESYNNIIKRRITTVLGPPGTGKSTFAIGLAMYYPSARVCYTASSHAAIDALCDKAVKALPSDECTRIVPTRTTIDCFQGFAINNTHARYVFSTINALPDIKCDIVVVDEISMLTNYELSTVNARLSYNHIVYVGDPYQLPAPRTLLTSGQLEPVDYNLVTNIMVNNGADVMLTRCYRCPAEIVNTVSKLVYGCKLEPVKRPSGACYKVLVNSGNDIMYEGLSAYNKPQLELACKFRDVKGWHDATFISPYNAMNLKAASLGFSTQTVDSSQGSEYNYVIFCVTTDSGHALNLARLNVALTRAKLGILVVFRQRDKLYDSLEFEELCAADIISGKCGTQPSAQLESGGASGTQPSSLFKICNNSYPKQPPPYALTWDDLGPDYVCEGHVAKCVGVNDNTVISYKYLVSMLGFVTNNPIPNYHNFILNKDQAKKYVLSWVGFDVEAAHAVKPHIGTNLPLQLGFSNGVNFSVKPEGFWVTESCTISGDVPSKIPPGDAFSHLKKDMRQGKPWTIIRFSIVKMLAELLKDTDAIVFVTWAHQLELVTMRYFVKIGVERNCDCGRRATFCNYDATRVGCMTHYEGLDYCYNPFIIDVYTWGFTGSLSTNHSSICTYHTNAHVASADAEMAVCVAINELFNVVDWNLTFPTTPYQDLLNKACRLVQANYMRILLVTMNTNVIHDIGNPKGIKTIRDNGLVYHFYDKNPVSSNVKTLNYNTSMASDFDGLVMFWNCNVDVYPANALVCRYDTHKQKHLIGPSGSALYVNKHAFLTPPMSSHAVHRLRLAPIVFYSDTTCSDETIVASVRECITRCNNGSTICSAHVKEYDDFVKAYTLMNKSGFNVYIPRDVNLFNCWLKFNQLQSLENLAYNCYYKNHNVKIKGELDVIITNNVVSVSVDGVIQKIFENHTILPVSVAFEHYTNRHVDALPTPSLLHGLGVDTTRNFTVWLNNDTLFPNTINVSTYTDVKEFNNRTILMDERYGSTLSDFIKSDNSIFISCTNYKKYNPVMVSAIQKCGYPCYGEVIYLYSHKSLNLGYITQGRSVNDFTPRTPMEIDFLSMDEDLFIAKYNCGDLGLKHIIYGDFSKSIVGGCHALISLVHSKIHADCIATTHNAVQNYIVVADNGSSKTVCTVLDLLLDDYVDIIRQAHNNYKTQSKVFSVTIDAQNVRFMIWHNTTVNTCYPLMQTLANGYQMPSFYKTLVTERSVCNIDNYHSWVPMIPGIMKNVLKYRQLMNYIVKKDCVATPHNMTVLHLGAASADGVAPGTSVLRQYFHEGTRIIDLDVRDFVSDANEVVIKDYRTFVPPDYVDFILSDMYSVEENFFDNLCHIVTTRLAYGGTFIVKFTEHSYSQILYELAGNFSTYEIFCTGVNAASSECWLCCFNYLNVRKHVVVEDMHSNYIKWRNEVTLKPIYSTLADIVTTKLKLKATPVIGFKEYNSKPILLSLVATGRLLVRPNASNVLF
uniref:ORF1ab polyprotein n=5 Tax=Orthocoronavirinae TaxID=2501931 RepID=A0AB39AGF7_9NIDO